MSILTSGFTKESADVNALQKIVGHAVNNPRTTGAIVGGVAGAAVGDTVDGGRGALVGAGAGATAGALGGRRGAALLLKKTKNITKIPSQSVVETSEVLGKEYKPVNRIKMSELFNMPNASRMSKTN